MSRWMGKYVIGITGNIATGKTTVRKLLEHLGAYTFEIDMITKRALSRDAPLYPKIAKFFGTWIFDENGRIQPDRLAAVLFANPNIREELDAIFDPVVDQAIDVLVQSAKRSVTAIESRKLIDSELAAGCDSIWVVSSPKDIQIQRLMKYRDLSKDEAQQRVMVEPPQAYKLRGANVVIDNIHGIENTWEQVKDQWYRLPKPKEPVLASRTPKDRYGLTVRLGMPLDATDIAQFITGATLGKQLKTAADVMRDLTEKAFILVEAGTDIVGLVGWRYEANVACVDEFYINKDLNVEDVIPTLMGSVEELSHEMLSEVVILVLPPYLARFTSAWLRQGYHPVTAQGLPQVEWQEVALNSLRRGHLLRYKQLLEERVYQVPDIQAIDAWYYDD